MDEIPTQIVQGPIAPQPQPKQPVDNITIEIANKKWEFRYVDDLKGSLGWTDTPKRRKRKIQILVGQSEREELGTIIHEGTHAAAWVLSEAAVVDIEKGIADLLWALGWRRNPDLGPVFNVQKADFSDDPCKTCEETHE